jgi:spore photoproduct lyase
MSYQPFKPRQLFVEKKVLSFPATKCILNRLQHLEPTIFEDFSSISPNDSREALILTRQKGKFYKRCPGTPNYLCCGYKIIDLVNNCDIGCSYCILQGYFESSTIFIYVNIEDMLEELAGIFKKHPKQFFRMGTGEFGDSLSTDHITEYSKELVPFFAQQPNALLELKTKSTQIDNFVRLPHNKRIVVSWSLNTPQIIGSEETFAPTLQERLTAARQCQQAGFLLSFHFDPMIYYDGWEDDYRRVVDEIFNYVDAQNIIWISLGALRYPSHSEIIMRTNHPKSKIFYGELIQGLDNKRRYFKSIRLEMFQKMNHWIRQYDKDIFIYLCMESPEIWQKTLGWTPANSGKLEKAMDELAYRKIKS